MKLLEEASSTEGAKKILKENEELKMRLERQKHYTTELMIELEEEKSAYAKVNQSAEQRERELRNEIESLKQKLESQKKLLDDKKSFKETVKIINEQKILTR